MLAPMAKVKCLVTTWASRYLAPETVRTFSWCSCSEGMTLTLRTFRMAWVGGWGCGSGWVGVEGWLITLVHRTFLQHVSSGHHVGLMRSLWPTSNSCNVYNLTRAHFWITDCCCCCPHERCAMLLGMMMTMMARSRQQGRMPCSEGGGSVHWLVMGGTEGHAAYRHPFYLHRWHIRPWTRETILSIEGRAFMSCGATVHRALRASVCMDQHCFWLGCKIMFPVGGALQEGVDRILVGAGHQCLMTLGCALARMHMPTPQGRARALLWQCFLAAVLATVLSLWPRRCCCRCSHRCSHCCCRCCRYCGSDNDGGRWGAGGGHLLHSALLGLHPPWTMRQTWRWVVVMELVLQPLGCVDIHLGQAEDAVLVYCLQKHMRIGPRGWQMWTGHWRLWDAAADSTHPSTDDRCCAGVSLRDSRSHSQMVTSV